MTYVFDTNVFSQIFGSMYPSSLPDLWKALDEYIEDGLVTSTREVMRELDNCRYPVLRQWAGENEDMFPVPSEAEAAVLRKIFETSRFQNNVEGKKLLLGGRNADCFVVARAAAIGGTVVTLEKIGGKGSAKIPNICDEFGIECISLEDFMKRENWVYFESQSTQSVNPSKSPAPARLILLILPLFGIFIALLMLALETRQQTASAPAFSPAPPRTVVNFIAPDFELPMLDGITLVSPSDYAGRPLFLNFWATWCAPCVRELPAFEAFIAEEAADEHGPALLTINLGETAAEINGFLEEIGVRNLPVAMDINQVVKLDYGVQNLPTTFVIDGGGRVRHLKLGEMKLEEMYAYLNTLDEPS